MFDHFLSEPQSDYLVMKQAAFVRDLEVRWKTTVPCFSLIIKHIIESRKERATLSSLNETLSTEE